MKGAGTVAQALALCGLDVVDARVLLAHVLGKDRGWLAAHAEDAISAGNADAFLALARRRRDGEPVAYLTGTREFWGLPLVVSPAVLIPRPETETLVEAALEYLPTDRPTRVLDLGTGSGAIALAIARHRPLAHVLATDISASALAVARANTQRLALANVELASSDWFAGVPPSFHGDAFDLIASNPPYVAIADTHLDEGDVRHEPRVALSSGDDGLDAIRIIVTAARAYLRPRGVLLVEHGYDQADAVHELFTTGGYADVRSLRDLAGIPRVVLGRAP